LTFNINSQISSHFSSMPPGGHIANPPISLPYHVTRLSKNAILSRRRFYARHYLRCRGRRLLRLDKFIASTNILERYCRHITAHPCLPPYAPRVVYSPPPLQACCIARHLHHPTSHSSTLPAPQQFSQGKHRCLHCRCTTTPLGDIAQCREGRGCADIPQAGGPTCRHAGEVPPHHWRAAPRLAASFLPTTCLYLHPTLSRAALANRLPACGAAQRSGQAAPHARGETPLAAAAGARLSHQNVTRVSRLPAYPAR